MLRQPPKSTLTDTRSPYTTLVRSAPLSCLPQRQQRGPCMADNIQARAFAHGDIRIRAVHRDDHGQWLPLWHAYNVFYGRPWGQKDEPPVAPSSAERRGGEECGGTCRSRWSPVQ